MTEIGTEGQDSAPADQPGGWLADLERLDLAVYAAIARTPSPSLDRAMSLLSRAADHSKLSVGAATAMALVGGRSGRRAALYGVASIVVTSAVVNGPLKFAARRPRPERRADEVPVARHVPMPVSRSFPSGHSAAAFAFASGVGHVTTPMALPLRALAATVAYSRIHTGVHYPADVVAGALAGVTIADGISRVLGSRGI